MTDKIQIDAGDSQFISAIHKVPEERSTRDLDELLVIMSHGFPGHKGSCNNLFGEIEFLLNEKGFHTLRFDYRGCGESDGREEALTIGGACEDFQNILYWAKWKGYRRFVYIGEGLGGTFCIMNHDLDVACYVLFWPAVNLRDFRKSALRTDNITEGDVARGYIKHEDNRIGLNLLKELGKIDLVYAIREIRVPCLIMHGAQDSKIPIDGLDLIRAHMPSQRIEITTFHDGGHGLEQVNHRKMMLYHIQQFIEKYV